MFQGPKICVPDEGSQDTDLLTDACMIITIKKWSCHDSTSGILTASALSPPAPNTSCCQVAAAWLYGLSQGGVSARQLAVVHATLAGCMLEQRLQYETHSCSSSKEALVSLALRVSLEYEES